MKEPPRFAGILPTVRVAACAAISLLLVPLTHAQAAAAGTSPATSSKSTANEQVVHLNPFEVTASKTVGYQAYETLAGTRIRTNMADVSASISVITPEFLQDIGATDNGTLLQYTPNAQVASPQGTYAGVGNAATADEISILRDPLIGNRIRGLAPADNARNFYISDIPWDSYNVSRISILRGPNSILYGLGSPAGIVNAATNQADFYNRDSVTFRTGSYGSNRASVDFNQQIIPNVLAVRVDGLWSDQKYEQKPAFDNDKRLYGALRFDPQLFRNPSFHTSLKVNWEHGEVNANRPRLVPPNDSVTPWFRPETVSASNPFGGMGRTLVNNLYDPWRTDNVVPGNGYGMNQQTTVNYQPWLMNMANQQQAYWMIDGTTNQLYGVNGGYINNGAVDTNGNFTGYAGGLQGRQTSDMFYGVNGLPGAVNNYDNATPGTFPLAKYGQYRTMSLLDPSVFDFYHTLIDGPTKSEYENWNAYDIDLTQTGWDNRVAFEFTYDRQKYKRGGQALLGDSPTLTLDILKNNLDYYLSGANGTTSVTNPNLGRPYVTSNGGSGNSYTSDREVRRGSLFAELRPSDFTSNSFLLKLFGKQRFNGVASDEKYYNEQRSWAMFGNSNAWDQYWTGSGNTEPLAGSGSRPPVAFIYLGSSIINRASASGANIPGITAPVTYQNAGVYVFDTTWKNNGVSPSAPWNVPSSLFSIYNGYPSPNGTTQLYQNSNPANYVGWNSNFQDNLVRYNNGQDLSLLTNAEKALRETLSYSGSYQGYFWNNALVATLGWRYDEVKTKDVTAQTQPQDKNILNVQPDVYNLDGGYPHSQIFKGHSTSGGAVLHINNLLPHDFLPINISVGYDESSNFQVTSVRRDIYGNPIGNPTGKTVEYSALLSTKDNKYSLRVVKYKTTITNGTSTLGNPAGLGVAIQQGLDFRNIYLYQLGLYSMSSANQDSYRNRWTNAYPTETAAQAQAEEDAAITGWNNIQKHLETTGFFKAWGFTPTGPDSILVDRTTYLSDPSKYQPDPSTVYAYTATPPQGFTVTADTASKGYEYEFIANPLPNWRVEVNASETTAVQNNVGGAALTDFVNYISSQLINSDGTLTPAGKLPEYGNPGLAIYPFRWGPWLSNYQLLKLQEGSAVPEIRKWRYNVITNYEFPRSFLNGALKGVGVGAAYRWIDKVVIGYPVGSNGQFELDKPYYGPSEGYADLWISYHRMLSDHIGWRIQLNVQNVGAKNKLIPVSVEPDGHTWATVRIAPVQQWFLTNTFTF